MGEMNQTDLSYRLSDLGLVSQDKRERRRMGRRDKIELSDPVSEDV